MAALPVLTFWTKCTPYARPIPTHTICKPCISLCLCQCAPMLCLAGALLAIPCRCCTGYALQVLHWLCLARAVLALRRRCFTGSVPWPIDPDLKGHYDKQAARGVAMQRGCRPGCGPTCCYMPRGGAHQRGAWMRTRNLSSLSHFPTVMKIRSLH